MPQLLVRDLEKKTIDRLKEQARRNRRSLQGEVKLILEEAVKLSWGEARDVTSTYRKALAGKTQSDSADLVREDRER
jgi:plasmid stability protein